MINKEWVKGDFLVREVRNECGEKWEVVTKHRFQIRAFSFLNLTREVHDEVSWIFSKNWTPGTFDPADSKNARKISKMLTWTELWPVKLFNLFTWLSFSRFHRHLCCRIASLTAHNSVHMSILLIFLAFLEIAGLKVPGVPFLEKVLLSSSWTSLVRTVLLSSIFIRTRSIVFIRGQQINKLWIYTIINIYYFHDLSFLIIWVADYKSQPLFVS